MKQSQFFIPTLKEAPKDEVVNNAKMLIRAGFIDKLMAGVYTFLPAGLRVLKKIENIIREEMNKIGGQEIFMPVLHPKENWEKTGRWDTLDDLFKFTSFYSKHEFALGATHEEIIAPLAKRAVFSYKDLPVYLYQIQTKFRDEKRAKSGLLRGREFIMKDLYSFHANETDMEKYYDKVLKSYEKIFKRLGIGDRTYLTFASGGSFSKYSHEFQTETEAGEDIIYLCEKCKIAVNKEIIGEQDSCLKCFNKNLKEIKAAEVGNIFKLKTKYSKSFNLTYVDKNGETQDVIMGCYGIGLSRVMGTIVEALSDERGIIWPESVAPFKVHLLLLGNDKKVKSEADKVYEKFLAAGVEILYDDRDGKTAGEKFAEADLIGIPYRVVVSGKTVKAKNVEVKERAKKEGKLIKINEFLKIITK